MALSHRFAIVGAIALMSWAGERLVRSHTHLGGTPAPAVAAQASGVAMDLPWGCMPPPGASSRRAWNGVDARGKPVSFAPCNCSDSVNLFIDGDPARYEYHNWPVETMAHPEESASWDQLESSLRIGDVVEFVAHISYPDGVHMPTLFHVQICAGAKGLMAGANNEARFEMDHGVPGYTGRWAVCTSREYYTALRSVDAAWAAAGLPRTYSVLIYRKPE